MHIVQLANFYQPRSGGIRVCLDEVAKRYLRLGYRCSLVVPDDHDGFASEALLGCDGPRRSVVRVRSPLVPGLGGYRMILDRQSALAALRSLEPDVLELSDKTTLARVAADEEVGDVPTVLISHERLDAVIGGTISGKRLVRAGIGRFNRRLAERVDAIVCASQFAIDEFRDGAPVALPKIHHIPLGVDLDTFRPRPGHARPAGSPIELVTVVRLSPEKEPWLVVETVRELVVRGVDVRATVYGDGALRDRLVEDAAGLPLLFAGHLGGRGELAAAIAAADVAIAPGPHETFGLGGLELLACGTPIVVPDRGALQELVVGDIGRVAPSDPAAFADSVVQLTRGDVVGRRRAARARAEEFSWDRCVDSMLALYDHLTTRGDRAQHSLRGVSA